MLDATSTPTGRHLVLLASFGWWYSDAYRALGCQPFSRLSGRPVPCGRAA